MGSLPKATKRPALIKRYKQLGWTGPHSGVGPHPEYMAHPDGRVVKLPNPHGKDIGEGLLKMMLDQAKVSADEWVGKEKKVKTDEEATAADHGNDEHEDQCVDQPPDRPTGPAAR